MNDRVIERYNTLKSEYEAGQKMLQELEAKRTQVVQTMTRIEGAMMVLRELIEGDSAEAAPSNGAAVSVEHAAVMES